MYKIQTHATTKTFSSTHNAPRATSPSTFSESMLRALFKHWNASVNFPILKYFIPSATFPCAHFPFWIRRRYAAPSLTGNSFLEFNPSKKSLMTSKSNKQQQLTSIQPSNCFCCSKFPLLMLNDRYLLDFETHCCELTYLRSSFYIASQSHSLPACKGKQRLKIYIFCTDNLAIYFLLEMNQLLVISTIYKKKTDNMLKIFRQVLLSYVN